MILTMKLIKHWCLIVSFIIFIFDINEYQAFIVIFLIANRVNFFGVAVPQTISSPTTDAFGTYLLLNSEFQNDTRLLGFQIYSQTAGLIQINVKKNIIFCIQIKKHIF